MKVKKRPVQPSTSVEPFVFNPYILNTGPISTDKVVETDSIEELVFFNKFDEALELLNAKRSELPTLRGSNRALMNKLEADISKCQMLLSMYMDDEETKTQILRKNSTKQFYVTLLEFTDGYRHDREGILSDIEEMKLEISENLVSLTKKKNFVEFFPEDRTLRSDDSCESEFTGKNELPTPTQAPVAVLRKPVHERSIKPRKLKPKRKKKKKKKVEDEYSDIESDFDLQCDFEPQVKKKGEIFEEMDIDELVEQNVVTREFLGEYSHMGGHNIIPFVRYHQKSLTKEKFEELREVMKSTIFSKYDGKLMTKRYKQYSDNLFQNFLSKPKSKERRPRKKRKKNLKRKRTGSSELEPERKELKFE